MIPADARAAVILSKSPEFNVGTENRERLAKALRLSKSDNEKESVENSEATLCKMALAAERSAASSAATTATEAARARIEKRILFEGEEGCSWWIQTKTGAGCGGIYTGYARVHAWSLDTCGLTGHDRTGKREILTGFPGCASDGQCQ